MPARLDTIARTICSVVDIEMRNIHCEVIASQERGKKNRAALGLDCATWGEPEEWSLGGKQNRFVIVKQTTGVMSPFLTKQSAKQERSLHKQTSCCTTSLAG